MGGTNQTITKYSETKEDITNYISYEKLVIYNYKEVVNKNNYKDKLKKYNLSDVDLKKIETSFNCSSRKIRHFKNNYFMKENYSIFRMSMQEFIIKPKSNNEKEILIKKKSLKYTINNPYSVIEKSYDGWGLLFFYISKVEEKQKRALELSEIEALKASMKKKLNN